MYQDLLSMKHVSSIQDWSYQSAHLSHYWLLPGSPSRKRSKELMMNSTFGSLTGCRSAGKKKDSTARRLEWNQKSKTTALHSWTHGAQVENVELCREHFGKPSRCMRIVVYHAFPTCRKFSNVISPARGIQCCWPSYEERTPRNL